MSEKVKDSKHVARVTPEQQADRALYGTIGLLKGVAWLGAFTILGYRIGTDVLGPVNSSPEWFSKLTVVGSTLGGFALGTMFAISALPGKGPERPKVEKEIKEPRRERRERKKAAAKGSHRRDKLAALKEQANTKEVQYSDDLSFMEPNASAATGVYDFDSDLSNDWLKTDTQQEITRLVNLGELVHAAELSIDYGVEPSRITI